MELNKIQIKKLERMIKLARRLLKKFPDDDFFKISIHQCVYKIKELRKEKKINKSKLFQM